MRITSNRDVNTQQGVRYAQDIQSDIQDRNVSKEKLDSGVKVSFSIEQKRKAILSDEELNCALENVLASDSNIYDVQEAERMISEANRNIFANANESILAQANQTPPMVAELTQ